MSLPVLPERPLRLSPWSGLLARAAVFTAYRLAKRSPRRIRAVLTRVRGGAPAATYEQAKAARDAVLTVSTKCCGPEACLPRSIAVALLCRARGHWPTWCVGVIAAPPFQAHAWVEAGGDVVDEPVDASFYERFFAVPPAGAARGLAGDRPVEGEK